jgi:hypothetical protein
MTFNYLSKALALCLLCSMAACSKKEAPPTAPTGSVDHVKKMDAEIAEYSRKKREEAAARAAEAANSKSADAGGPNAVDLLALVKGNVMEVEAFGGLCSKAQPTQEYAFMQAVDGWRRRNGAALTKLDATVNSLSSSERLSLDAGAKEYLEKSLGSIRTARADEKTKWCDTTTKEIQRGDKDLVGKAALGTAVKS